MVCVDSDRLGKATRVSDAAGRYIEFCKASVSRGFTLRGLRVVLDCAHGATYHVAPGVFEELGAEVSVIGNAPNGTNINAGCGSTHPELLARRVVEEGADVGIAFDGDGDRVVLVDARGEIVDGDEILFMIACHRSEQGTLAGGVVGTVMSNFGLERALADRGIPFCRASVGDRYVLEHLKERGWRLGGESSGHILCLDLASTGDAIVAALQVLVPMVERGLPLHELKRGMFKLPQVMINVRTEDPVARARSADLLRASEQASAALAGRGRVLIRPSGTEPVIRVMVEGESEPEVRRLAEELADCARGGR
jgi:phosphoglucosamine mutase